MKTKLTKKQAQEKINGFFRRENFSAEEVKKIKKLSMKFNIKLGVHRKKFCRKCLSKLKGKVSIKDSYKTVICENCGYRNKFCLFAAK